MKNTGIVRKIDKLGRVVIPKEIRNTLRILDDDSLELLVDGENIILKKFSYVKNFEGISQILLESVNSTQNKNILLYDSNNIISCTGIYKNKLKGNKPSDKLLEYMQSYKSLTRKGNLEIMSNFNIEINYYIKPIIANGIVLGVLMLFDEHELDNNIIMIIEIIGNFLGNYIGI